MSFGILVSSADYVTSKTPTNAAITSATSIAVRIGEVL